MNGVVYPRGVLFDVCLLALGGMRGRDVRISFNGESRCTKRFLQNIIELVNEPRGNRDGRLFGIAAEGTDEGGPDMAVGEANMAVGI